MKIKTETARWVLRYEKALRKHLAHGSGASMKPAFELGREAVALGLETLDLARYHEQIFIALTSSGGSSGARQGMIERAKVFFAEASIPIEKTHHSALSADIRVSKLKKTLRMRTVDSSVLTRHLERGIARRKAAETALKKSGKQHAKLLTEARRIQNHLRDQMREIMVMQENERKKTSCQLQNEIAQTLFGINIRLLTLKTAAKANTDNLSSGSENENRRTFGGQ